MKKKVSDLIKENVIVDTETFNQLSPIMKEAVKDIYDVIDKKTSDIISEFENAVDKVALFHNVNKKELYDYFEKETNKQIGV